MTALLQCSAPGPRELTRRVSAKKNHQTFTDVENLTRSMSCIMHPPAGYLSIILTAESLHQDIAPAPATGHISDGESLQFRILLRMGCHISNPYHVLRLHKLVIIVTLGTTGYWILDLKYISLSLADLQRISSGRLIDTK